MNQAIEAEIIEYLWPRMGDYRRSVLVKHLIHGDQRSAKCFLAHVKHGHKNRMRGLSREEPKVYNGSCCSGAVSFYWHCLRSVASGKWTPGGGVNSQRFKRGQA